MDNELKTRLQDGASGFECTIDAQDLRFTCMIPSGLFSSAPPIAKNPHNHPFFELHLIQSGSVTLLSDEQAFLLEKNDLALIPPGVYHTAIPVEEELRDLAFFFTFERIEGEPPQEAFYETFTEKLRAKQAPIVFKQAFGISLAMLALIEEMGKSHPCKQTRLNLKITEIMLQLIDLLCPEERGSFSGRFSQTTHEKLLIDSFFANNTDPSSDLKDLSELIFLSERQSNRVLQSLYGLPYKKKLIETRVQYAKYLLATTSLSIDEISRKCGYRSPVGFHAAFREVSGTTPAKYRSAAKKRLSISEK